MLFRQLSLCALWVAVASTALWSVADTVSAQEITVENEITYGKGGDVELQLDLARPKDGEGPFPAIVFVHGGGWRGGNRMGYSGAIREAARRGYVAVTVSYRLTDPDADGKARHPHPAQIHDVKCAVRWLRKNAAKYHVDPNRIGATGGSAGGHLSLMLGLTDAKAGLEGEGGHADVSSEVQAVVNVFGPTDLKHLYANSPGAAPILKVFLNGAPDDVATAYREASPLTYVDAGDPPVLTLHGTADTLVPPDQAELLDKKMKSAGLSHTLILLEGQGHGFRGEASKRANRAMVKFFDMHLKKDDATSAN